LRIIDWVHTQLKLRLVRIKAVRAHQGVEGLGLDDLFAKVRQLELEATAITHGDRVLG
jgi:hypothetical protein